MATPSAPPRRRGPPAVAWVLALAVLVGVAAALLSRPVSGLTPTTTATKLGGLSVTQVGESVAIAFFVILGIWLFFSLREAGHRSPVFGRIVSTALVMLLLGVLFVAVVGLVHFSPVSSTGNSTGTTNSTGGGTGSGSGNGSLPTGPPPGVTLPAWAGIAAIIAVAVLAGALLIPGLIARVEGRRRGGSEPEETLRETQNALDETLHRLSAGDEADARAAILALYARLLKIAGPRLGRVESRTPGEIRRGLTDTLHVRSPVAHALTQMFEEARYSSHPLTADMVGRARSALTDAIADLAASAGVPA